MSQDAMEYGMENERRLIGGNVVGPYLGSAVTVDDLQCASSGHSFLYGWRAEEVRSEPLYSIVAGRFYAKHVVEQPGFLREGTNPTNGKPDDITWYFAAPKLLRLADRTARVRRAIMQQGVFPDDEEMAQIATAKFWRALTHRETRVSPAEFARVCARIQTTFEETRQLASRDRGEANASASVRDTWKARSSLPCRATVLPRSILSRLGSPLRFAPEGSPAFAAFEQRRNVQCDWQRLHREQAILDELGAPRIDESYARFETPRAQAQARASLDGELDRAGRVSLLPARRMPPHEEPSTYFSWFTRLFGQCTSFFTSLYQSALSWLFEVRT